MRILGNDASSAVAAGSNQLVALDPMRNDSVLCGANPLPYSVSTRASWMEDQMTVVLITGALTGIGRAKAWAFAREGDQIVVAAAPPCAAPSAQAGG
jgi:hypothetical protein